MDVMVKAMAKVDREGSKSDRSLGREENGLRLSRHTWAMQWTRFTWKVPMGSSNENSI